MGDHVNVTADLSGTALVTLVHDPRVLWIESGGRVEPSDERFSQIGAGNFTISGATGPGYLSWLDNVGGAGGIGHTEEYLVNVIDTGLSSGQNNPVHADLRYLNAFTGKIHSWEPEDYSAPGDRTTYDVTGHGTMVAGIVAGNPAEFSGTTWKDASAFYWGMGVAPRTQLRITDIFRLHLETTWDATTAAGKLHTVTASAWNAGARFTNISSNLTSTPSPPGSPPGPAVNYYDTYAQAVDMLTRDARYAFQGTQAANYPMLFSISAGNIQEAVSPPNCLSCVLSPATAKNAITMGATSEAREYGACDDTASLNHVSGFSARGMRGEAGRIKPDFVAPGTRIVSAGTSYRGAGYDPLAVALCPSNYTGYVPSTGESYGYGRGTSYSAPQAAGQAVLLSKRYKNYTATDPSPAMIKAMMAAGAERMIGGQDMYTANLLTATPGIQGWGRLNLAPVATGPFAAADEDRATIPTRRFTSPGKSFPFP